MTLQENNPLQINFQTLISSVPNFDGKNETNFHFFLTQFESIAEEAKLNEKLKILFLKSKLSGHARDILLSDTALQDETIYATFVEKLKYYFMQKSDVNQSQNQFMSINQKPTENVQEFAVRFNLAAAKLLSDSGHSNKNGATDFLDTIKLSKFIQSLRPDLSFELKKIGPKSFEEALERAKILEIALNQHAEVNSIQNKDTSINDEVLKFIHTQQEEIQTLQKELNALKLKDNEIQTKQTTQLFCHICKKNNHDTDLCFFNAKNTPYSQPGAQAPTFYTPIAKPRFYTPRVQNNYNPRQMLWTTSWNNTYNPNIRQTPQYPAIEYHNSQTPRIEPNTQFPIIEYPDTQGSHQTGNKQPHTNPSYNTQYRGNNFRRGKFHNKNNLNY